MRNRDYLFLFCLALAGLFLSACGTTSTMRTSRTSPLPKYETPLVKRDFQNVRTTAYTHTEADHRQFTNHNALGGRLQAATGAIRRAEYTPRAVAVSADDDQADYRRASYNPSSIQPFSLEPKRTTKVIGSAAADWSRWPAGTVFRLLSTGQVYKIDDYGWALAGRNTIDLYMPSRSAMNSWGARAEGIQILRWGNPNESLRLLQAHQSYRHIRRMVLELQGQDAAAASLE
jgi:3D (Asp-Asp-Asp) domain-containing protein